MGCLAWCWAHDESTPGAWVLLVEPMQRDWLLSSEDAQNLPENPPDRKDHSPCVIKLAEPMVIKKVLVLSVLTQVCACRVPC